MREIKFRGKRVDNGEWVYGSYCPQCSVNGGIIHWIINIEKLSNNYSEVDPSTVGQYTGLKDTDGKEIHEGDIVKVTDEEGQISELNSDTGVGAVEWVDKWGYWNVSKLENGLGDLLNTYDVRIVGNTHDNMSKR